MPSKSANVKNEKQYEKLKKRACRNREPPASLAVPAPRAAVERNRVQAPALSRVARLRRRRRQAPREARQPHARNERWRGLAWSRG
jgi:hypothetical protein